MMKPLSMEYFGCVLGSASAGTDGGIRVGVIVAFDDDLLTE